MQARYPQESLRPGRACARMTSVVLRLGWTYAVSLGPIAGLGLIIAGVLLGEPVPRFAGAMVLGLSGAVLLNDLVQGLAGGGFPLRFIVRIRTYPRGRLAMILPVAVLWMASLGILAWASANLVLSVLRP